MIRFLVPALALTVFASGLRVDAQVLEAPARTQVSPDRARDPRLIHQTLTSTSSIMGGYDTDLALAGSSPFSANRVSGYTGFGDAALRYFLGNEAHSFNANGHGFVNSYSTVGVGPAYGGDASVGVTSSLGSKNRLSASQGVRSDPYLYLGAFDPLRTDLASASPDLTSLNAIAETRSVTADSLVNVSREWSRRVRSSGGYGFHRLIYSTGSVFDTESQSVNAAVDGTVSRTTSLRGSYRYSNYDYLEPSGLRIPADDHTIEGGFSYSKGLSRTRRITISAGGGALRAGLLATANPLRYWAPSGYGTFRLDVGRTWNVSADYRRALAVLQGNTPQFYITDALTLRTGGSLMTRTTLVFYAGYSNGQTATAVDGRYRVLTASTQLSFLLRRSLSALVGVNRYQYNLNGVAQDAIGILPQSHQNSVRFGLTWDVPIIAPPRTPRR